MNRSYLLRHKSGVFYYQKPAPDSSWGQTDDPHIAAMPYNKAYNTLINSIPKKEREDWQVVENIYDSAATTDEESDAFNWTELSASMQELYSKVLLYQNTLICRLSTVDQCICDVYHAVEQPAKNLNIIGGYKMYRTLRGYLQQRRTIKKEMDIVRSFLGCSALDHCNGKLSREIEMQEKLTYTPRLLPELFELRVEKCKQASASETN